MRKICMTKDVLHAEKAKLWPDNRIFLRRMAECPLSENGTTYTQSQKKRNFSLLIFPGAQGQGHVTLGHGK